MSNRKPVIFVLFGKSASGKDTLLNEILKTNNFLQPIISTTTRPMREGEINGKEYHFVNKEQFLSDIKQGKFIEYRIYNTEKNGNKDTWYYGVSKDSLKENQSYITILDVKGTKDLFDKVGNTYNVTPIFIDTKDNIRKERCIKRGDFDETEWNRRLEADTKDFSENQIEDKLNFGTVYSFDGSLPTNKLKDQFNTIFAYKMPKSNSFSPIKKETEYEAKDAGVNDNLFGCHYQVKFLNYKGVYVNDNDTKYLSKHYRSARNIVKVLQNTVMNNEAPIYIDKDNKEHLISEIIIEEVMYLDDKNKYRTVYYAELEDPTNYITKDNENMELDYE